MKIRQLKGRSGAKHRGKAGRIQTEEINSRHAVVADIGPHIQLTEFIEKRQRGSKASADAAHPKRRHGNVSRSVTQVQFQLLRHQRPHLLRRKRPMGKEQIVPFLLHAPRRAGHGDRTVRGFKQQWMH